MANGDKHNDPFGEAPRSTGGFPWSRAVASSDPAGVRFWERTVEETAAAAIAIGSSTVPGHQLVLIAVMGELLRRYGADPVTLQVRNATVDRGVRTLDLDFASKPSLRQAVSLAETAWNQAGGSAQAGDPARALAVVVGEDDRLPTGARVGIQVTRATGPMTLRVQHDPRWVSADQAAVLGERAIALLTAAGRNPDSPMDEVDLVTPGERALLLGSWAGRRVSYPHQATVSALLREVAAANPERVAVEDQTSSLTYATLVERAAGVRDVLRTAGLRAGDRIGVYLDRTPGLVVALAGILESDGCYVPIDRDAPPARARAMVQSAAVRAVLCAPGDAGHLQALLAPLASDCLVVPLPDAPGAIASGGAAGLEPVVGDSGQAAYVLFTSGSTGEPKGVEVPHRAIVRLVRNNDFVDLNPAVRMLGFAPASFDASTFEIWGALLNAGTLVLAPPGLPSMGELAGFIASRRIDTLWLTSALFQELASYHLERLAGVRQLLTGGDVVPADSARQVMERFPAMRLVNGYGPTENTTFTCCHTLRPGEALDPSVPIGRPIANTTVHVLDERQRLVPPGMVGELWVGGDGLALGYVNRPDLTSERFVAVTLGEGGPERLYRTGDLVRHLPDGALEFLGRVDGQIKIRGFRVELEEIETALRTAPGIALAAVAAVGDGAGRRLRAGLVAAPGAGRDEGPIRAFLRDRLPPYMLPAEFLWLDRLPVTASGKIDRRALAARPVAPGGTPARGEADTVMAGLRQVWSDLLARPDIGLDDAFFEIGGNSLLALRMVEEMRRRTGIDVPVLSVFEFPTLRLLSRHLAAGPESARRPAAARPARRMSGGVAIIGMAGRFPGAPTVDALWRLLVEEREAITRFDPGSLEIDPALARLPNYTAARGILDGVEQFDAGFFQINPRFADIMDPQQRLLLETAWEAFEDAGYAPPLDRGLVGVFAGVSHNTYFENNVLTRPDVAEEMGALQILFGNDKDFVASHIAHRLDLRGPAVTVLSASSTSLTAVALGVQAIRSGLCDVALAGGASVTVPVRSGHLHEDGAMFSRDGSTRTFDAEASGTVFSDGAAVVLLKRLEDAEADGDRILAVIRGVGVTNDGGARASFSAPTVEGQALCVTRALADAGWTADQLSYVEAHGTATPLGDPIEIEALNRAFAESTARRHFCLIGSLKSNIGHLTAAAGVAGLIKTVLAMRHRYLPPTLHFRAPNPRIAFADSPFLVSRLGAPWQTGSGPRRAGVSGFGAGGTNAHVVLEEWAGPVPGSDEPGPHLLRISARSEAALAQQARDLADALDGAHAPLGWIARTLREGRKVFPVRGVVAARDAAAAARRLRALATESGAGARRMEPSPLVLLFPGQGTQYPGMADALCAAFPAVRAHFDRCADLLGPLQGRDLRDWVSGAGAAPDQAAAALQDTAIGQPALFALQYAVARTLMDWGLGPAALIGHSIGELTAACLAGVMDLEAALRVVAQRGQLMGEMPRGAMLSIRSAAEEIGPLLGSDVVIAAVNAPRLCVASGPAGAVAALQERLTARDIPHRPLRTSHAFHSPMMDPAVRRFEALLRDVRLNPPSIPFVACPAGRLITPDEARSPAYWARQLRDPVRFMDGLRALAGPGTIFLEVGPRATLTALVRQTLPGRVRAVSAMEQEDGDADGAAALLAAFGRLWCWGVDGLDWDAADPVPHWQRVSLPTYPFERKRHWIEPGVPQSAAPAGAVLGDGNGSGWSTAVAQQRALIRNQQNLLERLRQGREPAPAATGRPIGGT